MFTGEIGHTGNTGGTGMRGATGLAHGGLLVIYSIKNSAQTTSLVERVYSAPQWQPGMLTRPDVAKAKSRRPRPTLTRPRPKLDYFFT